jgi:tripartite-type tricarboxylate transporter receptor subunit TctC
MLAKPTFLSAIVAVACAASGIASAQTFPNRPIRIVVGFAPAGPADVMSLLIGMSKKRRQDRACRMTATAQVTDLGNAVVPRPFDGVRAAP